MQEFHYLHSKGCDKDYTLACQYLFVGIGDDRKKAIEKIYRKEKMFRDFMFS